MKLTLNRLAERTAAKIDESNTKELAEVLYLALQKEKKINQIGRLLEMVEQKLSESGGYTLAEVASARELTNEEEEKIKSRLEKKILQKVMIKKIVDERLIDGIKIKIKDEITDLSIRGALLNLKSKLSQGAS